MAVAVVRGVVLVVLVKGAGVVVEAREVEGVEELRCEDGELVVDAFVVLAEEMGVVDGLVDDSVDAVGVLAVDGLDVVVSGVDVVDGLVLVVDGVLVEDGFVEVEELVDDGLVVVVDTLVLVELGVGDVVDVGGHQVVVLVVRIVTIFPEDEGAILSSSATSRPCRAFNSLRGPNGWS